MVATPAHTTTRTTTPRHRLLVLAHKNLFSVLNEATRFTKRIQSIVSTRGGGTGRLKRFCLFIYILHHHQQRHQAQWVRLLGQKEQSLSSCFVLSLCVCVCPRERERVC